MRPPFPWNKCKQAWERILCKMASSYDRKPSPSSSEFSDAGLDEVVNSIGPARRECDIPQMNNTSHTESGLPKKAAMKKHLTEGSSVYRSKTSDTIEPDIRSYYSNSAAPKHYSGYHRKITYLSPKGTRSQVLGNADEQGVCRHTRNVRASECKDDKTREHHGLGSHAKHSRICPSVIRHPRRAKEMDSRSSCTRLRNLSVPRE